MRISTPPAPVTCRRLTSTRRSSRPPRWTQGAVPNDTKVDAKPRRETLGRSRGGLTTKIHLAADTRCRPISRVTTAGHRHDCLAFESVMAGIRIHRKGRGRPRTRPGRVLGDKAYSTKRSAPTCGDARSKPPSPSQPTVCVAHARADDHHDSTPRSTSNATSSNAASTNSRATARWQAAMTNATTCTAEPSTSHRSESGSAIPSHDPRDRL